MTTGDGPHIAALAGVGLSLALVSCGPAGTIPSPGEARQEEAAYLSPPVIESLSRAGSNLRLEGRAVPGAAVRLASPGGAALKTTADSSGRWSLETPASGEAQVFGLSQVVEGRTLQSEGYILLAQGEAWQLRSGAAARPLATGGARGIVVDYDRSGGAVVSGVGPAEALLVVQLDGRRAGEGRADASGRFEIRLKGPAPMGESRLRVYGEGLNLEAPISLSPPVKPVSGPVRVKNAPDGLRIDWMTPGGGVQTTQILPPTSAR